MDTNKFCCLVILLLPSILSENYFCNLQCAQKHTACYCSRGDKCGENFKPLPLDDSARLTALAIHNEYRNLIASGSDERGGNGKASNMRALSYNKELEHIAQCWANSCENKHDDCRITKKFRYVGQNIFWASSNEQFDLIKHEFLKKAVRAWYGEITNCSSDIIDSFGKNVDKIGHFTQVVWATTIHVGCGRAIYGGGSETKIMIVCNYAGGGNVERAPVYLRGEPRSKCNSRNERYDGLCGDIEDFTKDNWTPPLTQAGVARLLPIKLLLLLIWPLRLVCT